MGTHLIILFSISIISILFISMLDTSYGEQIIATSSGFEYSTILELKNSRGNLVSIDSVRIWLGGENEFKSFKTEQGWMGKNTPQGVIVFTSNNEVNPGESVKFGIKTIEKDPVINWKALDKNNEVIFSASTKFTEIEKQEETNLNQPKIITIKDESNFRFIPEKPTADSDFRVIGENFVPNQILDFYIQNDLTKSVKVDEDGKILFTAKAPKTENDDRVEFVLRDSGGSELSLSIRIPNFENRNIPEIIKLSLGNTPQEVKRGEILTLKGMATPNTTLTITSKNPNGDIINIDTIQVGFDGNWSYDNLFSPELELGPVSIEIDDGKNTALRNVKVISAKMINIFSEETMYNSGETVVFDGTAIPNTDISIILEDSIGAEIFSRTISVGESGNVSFNIEIPRGAVEGTYVLTSFQDNEQGVTIFGVGQEPEEILILRSEKLNFASGESAKVIIQGPVNSQISLILIDSADREKFSDSINLGPDGKEIYKISTDDLPNGAYSLNAKRGESSGSAIFTVGLTTGSGSISLQTTRDNYEPGEQILILGNTGSINVLLDISVMDGNGNTIKKINTFSDRFGVFKVDNFRIPTDAESGVWTINAKSGGNFKETKFTVTGETGNITVSTDKKNYDSKELITISGTEARMSSTVTIKILDSEGGKLDELNITAKSNGEYITIWSIPASLETGEYEIIVDDGSTNTSIKFNID